MVQIQNANPKNTFFFKYRVATVRGKKSGKMKKKIRSKVREFHGQSVKFRENGKKSEKSREFEFLKNPKKVAY